MLASIVAIAVGLIIFGLILIGLFYKEPQKTEQQIINTQDTDNPTLNTLLLSGGNGRKIDFNANWAEGKYFYRSKYSGMEFEFTVKKVGLTYRIYIDKEANYGKLKTDGHSTHRLYDLHTDQHYVCIPSSDEPETVSDALTWLEYWAEATDFYISTGNCMDDLDKTTLDSLS